jgi:hypothetical protein
VSDRRQEPVVVEDTGEVVDADEDAVAGEREIDGIQGREQAEGEQQQCVPADEEVAATALRSSGWRAGPPADVARWGRRRPEREEQ